MRDLFGCLLGKPIFEGQDSVPRDVRLLRLVLLSVVGFVILNTAGLLFVYKRKLAVSIFLFVLLAIAALCFWLMRRGQTHLASTVLVFGLWCLAAARVGLQGGLMGPSSFCFFVVCVYAALLLGSRGLAICVLLTVATATGMLISESLGYPIPRYFFVLPLPSFITFTCALLFVLIPLNLLVSELRSALGLAERKLKESEDAIASLRESEDRYRDLVEHSDDLICTHDLEGNLLTVNDPPARILGYTKEELFHRPMRDFVVPEARVLCDAYLSQIQRDGFAKGILPVLTKNGEVRLWEYSNTLRREGVNLPVVRGIAHDVTEQKRAEKELCRSEEKFSKAFRCSPSIISISTLEEGMFIEVNEAFEKLSEYSRSEAIGHTALELRLWRSAEERQQFVEEIRKSGHARNKEIGFRAKSGSIVVVMLSGELIDLADRKCLLVIGQDITQQKEAETALRHSEADYRSLFLQAPYGIYRVKPGGTFLIVNQALVEMLGYETADELCSAKREQDLFRDPDDRQRMIEHTQRRNDRSDLELYWKRKDGGSVLVRAKSRIFKNGKGEIEYYETMVEDITEKRAIERNLQQLQRMEAIGLLAAGIAHDFSNILTGILGCAELARKTLCMQDPNRDRVETIVETALRGRELTGKLLAFSQDEVSPIYPINLDEQIQGMENSIRAMIDESIKLQFYFRHGSEQVLLKTGVLYQILLNLALNAKDAMPTGGTLGIRTSLEVITPQKANSTGVPPGRYICLEVSDTGHGMEKALLDRIFDPFFTTKEATKGTGLGLYTVFGIVRQCAGHIRVSSEIGHGSTFRIYFPVFEKAEQKEFKTPESISEGEAKEVILLVEDDATVRNVVRDQLTGLGYSVLCESNAVQALQDVAGSDGDIDLLLADIVMPDLSGPDLARRLKEKQPSLKVLYMTGYARADAVSLDDVDIGAELLRKPFTEEELSDKVRHILCFRPQ